MGYTFSGYIIMILLNNVKEYAEKAEKKKVKDYILCVIVNKTP